MSHLIERFFVTLESWLTQADTRVCVQSAGGERISSAARSLDYDEYIRHNVRGD